MRKIAIFISVLCLSVSMFTGCGNSSVDSVESESEEKIAETVGETEPATTEPSEESTEEPSEESTEAAKSDDGGSNTAAATLDTTDWKDMQVVIDGILFALPCDYSSISDQWSFDLTDYGYDEYIMNPNDKVSSTIDLENPNYDATLSVGFTNTGTSAADIRECQLWSVGMSIEYKDTYPEILLPGNITWGSSIDDVVAAYGEPEDEPYYSEDLNYYSYSYEYDYEKYMKLTIYEDGGLMEFSLKSY